MLMGAGAGRLRLGCFLADPGVASVAAEAREEEEEEEEREGGVRGRRGVARGCAHTHLPS